MLPSAGTPKKPFGASKPPGTYSWPHPSPPQCKSTSSARAMRKGVWTPSLLGSGVMAGLLPSLASFCPFSPQIEEQLRRAEGKVGRKALSESDYMEVLERSCSQGWER